MTPITLTAEMIDHLIGARNRITERRDEMIDFRAVDHIDAVLSAVPHGERPDVDAMLGRKRIVMVQHADLCTERTALAELTDDEIALMEARCSETASEAPTHDGMWK